MKSNRGLLASLMSAGRVFQECDSPVGNSLDPLIYVCDTQCDWVYIGLCKPSIGHQVGKVLSIWKRFDRGVEIAVCCFVSGYESSNGGKNMTKIEEMSKANDWVFGDGKLQNHGFSTGSEDAVHLS